MLEEERSAPRPTPITVIGGFLGAGKTTLLNAVIRRGTTRRLGVLVNDFGAINIDADLVVGVEEDVVNLGGGCICCTIREDLVRSILEIMRRPDPPEHLVIEASGVSDPAAVARAVAVPYLRSVVALDGVVVVIDAEAYLTANLRERIVTGGQLKAADIVVLSKTDLLDAADVEAVKAKIRRVVTRARIVEAPRGDIPAEVVLGVHSDVVPDAGPMSVKVHRVGDEPAEIDHTKSFGTWSYSTDVPLSARRLRRIIDRLPSAVYRVKGIVQLVGERSRQAVLQVVGRRAHLEVGAPWGDAPARSRLVFIGAPGCIDPVALEALLRDCEAPDGGLQGGVWQWVRSVFDG
ncbi:MAG: GTP-binding protein [Myxococcales bacterium FL481]|nr:MAG: GTP-binding protein [Myxococcales bacterium FL481]